MNRSAGEEGKVIKNNKVIKTIGGLVGSMAVGVVVLWAMPKVQRKMTDKIYNNIMQ